MLLESSFLVPSATFVVETVVFLALVALVVWVLVRYLTRASRDRPRQTDESHP